ncbi:hypothetical protein UFOVP67_49 [uncultured Caudovirales phage]|uniref:Exodeoxyribonuclease X-like C-terminal domain-containing protein n=1 Tax=uncultured Caudovirales phage TaxID=2100421 RepID=A0A6J5T919_9CAUD|nr:hypothetical protein UFOVP67_49 [uncultured Caudovirales phage]
MRLVDKVFLEQWQFKKGKYEGQTIETVLHNDPSYVKWYCETVDGTGEIPEWIYDTAHQKLFDIQDRKFLNDSLFD